MRRPRGETATIISKRGPKNKYWIWAVSKVYTTEYNPTDNETNTEIFKRISPSSKSAKNGIKPPKKTLTRYSSTQPVSIVSSPPRDIDFSRTAVSKSSSHTERIYGIQSKFNTTYCHNHNSSPDKSCKNNLQHHTKVTYIIDTSREAQQWAVQHPTAYYQHSIYS